MSSNGLISFGAPYRKYAAISFPSANSSDLYERHIVAPYWTDNDPRIIGNVSWEMYSTGYGRHTDDIIERISFFIQTNKLTTTFNGKFVFVATWSEMYPYIARQFLRIFPNRVSGYS